MAYLGRQPVLGNFVKLDAITVVNGQAAYTMQNGGVNFTDYTTVNQFLVSLNGTIQAATDSFTVSGSTITFASNLSTGDVIDFIIVFGNSLSAGTVSDSAITTAKLASTSVTAAKLNNDIISGSTELASEPADTDEFLVSDAGTLKRIDYSLIKGGGITQADMWRLTTNTSLGSKISSNLERVDSSGFGYIGTGMSQSSGDWSFPETGIYLVKGSLSAINQTTSSEYIGLNIKTTIDNSSYTNVAESYDSISGTDFYANAVASTIFDVTNTSTHKLQFFTVRQNANSQALGGTTISYTWFQFIRLGDT